MTIKPVLSGNLGFLNLADLLQLLGSISATGVLKIVGKYSQHHGFIYLEKGNPVNAKNGSFVGLEALNSLFGWIEGDYEFSREAVIIEKTITKSRMQVILDGIRMLDDGLIEKVSPVCFEGKKSTDDYGDFGPLVKGPLVDYVYVVDEEEFQDGEEIVMEGKHGNWIWVILEGSVQVAKETPKGRLNILRLGDGSFLGSFASFQMHGNIRGATTLAIGKVQLGVLDTQRLFLEFAQKSPEMRTLLICMDKRLRQVTNTCVELYLGKRREVALRQTSPLIRQGHPEDRLFSIVAGKGYVTIDTPGGPFVIGNLSKGDFLGNLRFLNIGHEPDHASIYVSEQIELHPLPCDLLAREYDSFSTTFKNIAENLATGISVTNLVVKKHLKTLGSARHSDNGQEMKSLERKDGNPG
jgi:CRP-like cAMP-binding protein